MTLIRSTPMKIPLQRILELPHLSTGQKSRASVQGEARRLASIQEPDQIPQDDMP